VIPAFHERLCAILGCFNGHFHFHAGFLPGAKFSAFSSSIETEQKYGKRYIYPDTPPEMIFLTTFNNPFP
jgi:hypothetical protein